MHATHFCANLRSMRGRFSLTALLMVLGITLSLRASDPTRDFSGKWVLDPSASDIASLGQVETNLNGSQGGGGILCSAGAVQWSYALDGSETRQVVRANNGEAEGTLVFRREGAPVAAPPAAVPEAAPASEAPPATGWRSAEPGSDASQPVLAKRPAPGAPPDVTVPSGTRVLLSLINEVNTKHTKEGDHVYLRTASPVAVSGRVVIPRGSDVEGIVTRAKQAGKVVGKGELYIRFDSLILPNGLSRDFRARPPGEEGKVEGGGKSADGRTVMEGAGIGATVGAITRGLGGAAVGGVGGALAGVLLSRNQNVVLPAGTHLEMVLDRDLVFHPDELP